MIKEYLAPSILAVGVTTLAGSRLVPLPLAPLAAAAAISVAAYMALEKLSRPKQGDGSLRHIICITAAVATSAAVGHLVGAAAATWAAIGAAATLTHIVFQWIFSFSLAKKEPEKAPQKSGPGPETDWLLENVKNKAFDQADHKLREDIEKKELTQVEGHLREILKTNPCDYAQSRLGIVLGLQKRYPEAEKELQEALKQSPNNTLYMGALGDVLRLSGKTRRAVLVLHEALQVSPGDKCLLRSLGDTYYALAERDYAEELLSYAFKLSGSSHIIGRTLSEVLKAQGKKVPFDLSLSAIYERKTKFSDERGALLDIFEDSLTRRISLTTILSSSTFDEVEKFFGPLKIPKEKQDERRDYCDFLFRNGKLDEAEVVVRESLTVAPEDPLNLGGLGKVLGAKKQVDQAKKLLQHGMEIADKNNILLIHRLSLRSELAKVLSSNGEAAAAEVLLLKAYKMCPLDDPYFQYILLELADVWSALDKREEAQKRLRAARMLYPQHLFIPSKFNQVTKEIWKQKRDWWEGAKDGSYLDNLKFLVADLLTEDKIKQALGAIVISTRTNPEYLQEQYRLFMLAGAFVEAAELLRSATDPAMQPVVEAGLKELKELTDWKAILEELRV